jgi:N-acetyl-anhydromuramyl-L-alanine amidase AmpD
MFVVHWDATLSSALCKKILVRRGLSVHFSIDNDGTIYQMVNCNHSAQHAGSVNKLSIGVEITNAVAPKYQQYYERAGFGKRPLVTGTNICHGKNYTPILGFYPAQIEALEALIKAVCGHYDIPLETPHKNGVPISTVYPLAKAGKFRGVVHHLHLDRDKYDACSINLVDLLNRIKAQ